MHELSIAESLVTSAISAIKADVGVDGIRSAEVSEVHLRLGRLAGVEKDSLLFCYDLMTKNTLLEGSQLVIEEIPIVIFCPVCVGEVELPGIQSFTCTRCGQQGREILRGKELELSSIIFSNHPNPLV